MTGLLILLVVILQGHGCTPFPFKMGWASKVKEAVNRGPMTHRAVRPEPLHLGTGDSFRRDQSVGLCPHAFSWVLKVICNLEKAQTKAEKKGGEIWEHLFIR